MRQKYFVWLVFFLLAVPACADEAAMPPGPDYQGEILAPEQRAVLYWDGTTEQLMVSPNITLDDVTGFSWVVPLQSTTEPVVEAAHGGMFFELVDMFDREPGGYRYATVDIVKGVETVLPLTSATDDVWVVGAKKTGIYDVAILRATDSAALFDLLNENGFDFPDDKQELLWHYVSLGAGGERYYFIASRVNLNNRYPGMVVSDLDRECAEIIEAITASTIAFNTPQVAWNIGGHIEEIVPEYEECEGANLEALKALAEVNVGITHALKYTFTPKAPVYPVQVTSANPGYTDVRLFLVGPECFEEEQELFMFQGAVQDKEFTRRYGFGTGECITKSRFGAETAELDNGAYFSEIAFRPDFDPNYRRQMGGEGLEFVVQFMVFAFFAAIAILAFGVGAGAAWAEARFRRPLLFKAIAVVLLLAIGYIFQGVFLEHGAWGIILLLHLTAYPLAGHISLRKKSRKLFVAALLGLLSLSIAIFLVFAAMGLFSPMIVY